MVREKWGVQLALCLCFKVSATWKYLSWHQNPLFLVLWPMVDNLFDFLTAIHILQPSRLLISRQLNVKTWMFMNMMSQTLRALNQSDFIRLSLGTLYRFDQALGIRQHPGPSSGILRMPLFWSFKRWIFYFIWVSKSADFNGAKKCFKWPSDKRQVDRKSLKVRNTKKVNLFYPFEIIFDLIEPTVPLTRPIQSQ